MSDNNLIKGLILPSEISPFDKKISERKTIRSQFCGQIKLLDDLNFTCQNDHNTNNKLRFNAPVGLPNLGNTCYLSAALQSLLNITIFVQTLMSIPESVIQQAAFLNLFVKFVLSYKKKDKDAIILHLKEIKSELGKENSEFKGTKMCDAGECQEVILDILDSEVQELCNKNIFTGKNFVRNIFTFKIGTNKKCLQCKENDFLCEPSKHFPCEIEFKQFNGMHFIPFLQCIRENVSLFYKNCTNCKGIGMEKWEIVPSVFLFQIRRVNFEEKRVTKIKRKLQIPEGFSIGLERYKISSVTSHVGDSPKGGHWLTDLR